MRPEGLNHPKAVHSYELVERIRSEHESGKGPKALSEHYNIPLPTIRNWVYLVSRSRA